MELASTFVYIFSVYNKIGNPETKDKIIIQMLYPNLLPFKIICITHLSILMVKGVICILKYILPNYVRIETYSEVFFSFGYLFSIGKNWKRCLVFLLPLCASNINQLSGLP